MHKQLHLMRMGWLLIVISLLGCTATVIQKTSVVSPLPTQEAALEAALIHLQRPDISTAILDKLELTIVLDPSIKVSNPFDPDEVDLQVRFQSPDKMVALVNVLAFWDGPNGWRVRFTPRNSGQWQATAILRTPTQRFTSSPLYIDVAQSPPTLPTPKTPPTLPTLPPPAGFIGLHPQNPRYLAVHTAQGETRTFFPIGLNLGWASSLDSTLNDYERWFDTLHANGGNTARLWMSSWAFGLEWDDTGLGDYTRRLDRARLLDRVIEMAEARGIYLIVVLINHGAFSTDTNPEWARNPYNAANGGPCATPAEFVTNAHARELFKRRLRYIAARWAYSPHILAWEWWNEVELTRIETATLKPWLQEMSVTLREFDPYQHLSTISYAGDGDPAIWSMPEIDLIQRHEYNIGDPKWFKPVSDINALQRIPKKIIKPVLIGEFGYSPDGERNTAAGQLGIHFHNSLWASAFNGFAGGALYWWWDTLVEPANLWPHYQGFAQFLQGIDLAKTSPVSATIDSPFATVLARKTPDGAILWVRNNGYSQTLAQSRFLISRSTGETFAFVVPPLKNVNLILTGLPDGSYRIQWIETLTGNPISADTVAVIQGRLLLTIPMLQKDWAAKLTR